jgi:hypothetical protein
MAKKKARTAAVEMTEAELSTAIHALMHLQSEHMKASAGVPFPSGPEITAGRRRQDAIVSLTSRMRAARAELED